MKPIFVFGSNLAGRHGAGAARRALRYHGAVYGPGKALAELAWAKDEPDCSDIPEAGPEFFARAARRDPPT